MPRNSSELHPAPCMHDVQCVCRLGPSHTSKQNFLSLILLILLPKLMNQKRDICRCYILYPLRLGPPFPNDAKILRPKVGLGPNQMLIDLRNVKIKNIIFYEQINYFWKIKGHGNPRPVHASTNLRTQARCIRMQAQIMHVRFQRLKNKFSILKLRLGTYPTSFGSHSKSPFSQYKQPYIIPFQSTQKS